VLWSASGALRKPSPNLVGLGGAEPSEDGERFLPALAGRLHAPGITEGDAEDFERTSPTPAVPEFPSNGQRALPAVDRIVEPP